LLILSLKVLKVKVRQERQQEMTLNGSGTSSEETEKISTDESGALQKSEMLILSAGCTQHTPSTGSNATLQPSANFYPVSRFVCRKLIPPKRSSLACCRNSINQPARHIAGTELPNCKDSIACFMPIATAPVKILSVYLANGAIIVPNDKNFPESRKVLYLKAYKRKQESAV